MKITMKSPLPFWGKDFSKSKNLVGETTLNVDIPDVELGQFFRLAKF